MKSNFTKILTISFDEQEQKDLLLLVEALNTDTIKKTFASKPEGVVTRLDNLCGELHDRLLD